AARSDIRGSAEARQVGNLPGAHIGAVPDTEVNAMERSRRDFLRTCACAFGTAAFASSVRNFGLINALAQDKAITKPELAPSYKARVGVFLFGGNDSNNVVIRYDGYSQYLAIRPASGTDSINIPQSSLLQITAASQGGAVFGLHPAMPELQQLYIGNKLAVVC